MIMMGIVSDKTMFVKSDLKDETISYLIKECGYNPIQAAEILDNMHKSKVDKGEPVSFREVFMY